MHPKATTLNRFFYSKMRPDRVDSLRRTHLRHRSEKDWQLFAMAALPPLTWS